MPLILVVEPDEGVLERVRGALGPEGWRVTRARGVAEAMGRVASEAPDLFLVSTAVERAQDILEPFARRRGGPGTLALVPERQAGWSEDERAAAVLGADGVLSEPFVDADLVAAVSKILRGADRRRAQPGADEPKLTSADIFGDLVAEVEQEARKQEAPRPAPLGGSPPGRPPGAEPLPRPRRVSSDDEIERKLEETLSGVLGPSRRTVPSRSPSPPASKTVGDKPPVEKPSEVDELISKTLSGLDLGGGAGRRKRPAGAPPAPPAAEPFDLSDLEEMIRSHQGAPRRPAEAAPGPEAGPFGEASGQALPPEPAVAGPTSPPGSLDEPAQVPSPEAEVTAEEEVPSEPAEPAAAAPSPEAGPEELDEAVPATAASPEAPRKDSAQGVEFGQYRLLERIGVGGMAEVWKARMTGVEGFQKTVAIKKILPHLTDSPAFVDMFIDEAKLAAQLNHANIIHIYDLGKIGADYYIAMEYVEGENLRNILNAARERGKPLSVGLALHVAARLASALEHAHHKRDFEDRDLGLVHRDVSPQNVLIGYEGTIKLCDFGIVKAVSKSSHTQMGALKGKLQYMSPEQAWGKVVDGRSDIFAVGTLLFEMLTGRRLFAGESEMEVLEAVRECRVQKPSELRPEVSDDVDAVVLKALEVEPGERFQSAGDLARRLEDLLAAMRPSPGQAELAAYMAELFDRARGGAAGQESPVVLPPRAGTGTPAPPAAPAGAAPAAGESGGEPAERSEPGSEVSPALQAVEPVSPVEPEEGGGRGKGLLVAAILVALVVGALLVWYFLRPAARNGAAPETQAPVTVAEPAGPPEATPDQAQEQASAPAPAGAAQGPVAGETQPEGAGAGSETAAEGAREGAQEAPTPEVAAAVDRALKERLAQREKELRSQFEAEERRLKDQLDEIQKTKAAPDEPPPKPAPREEPAPPKAAPSGLAKSTAEAAEAKPDDSGGGPAAAPGETAATVGGPEAQPAAGKGSTPSNGPANGAAAGETPSPSPTPGGKTRQPPATDSGVRSPAPKPEPPPAPREPAVREGELIQNGPGVVRPQLVSLPKPEYPPIARRLRVAGEVVVSVLVDETGRVVDSRLDKRVRQDVGLNEAALDAARRARFRPATKNGVRVKMWTTISFPFKL